MLSPAAAGWLGGGHIYFSRPKAGPRPYEDVAILKLKDIVTALLVSMTLTFGAGFLYVFYPIITALFRIMFESSGTAGTDGVVAVAVGVSRSFLLALFMLEPFIFLIIFALLQKRHARR